jgi:hypothetical protein
MSKASEYQKEYRKKYPWAKTIRNIWGRTKNPRHHYFKKGIKSSLTLNEAKMLWFRDKAYLMKKPSIDRIDPKLGYSLKNCRYVEYKENMKRRRTIFKLVKWIKEKYPHIIEEFFRT